MSKDYFEYHEHDEFIPYVGKMDDFKIPEFPEIKLPPPKKKKFNINEVTFEKPIKNKNSRNRGLF